MSPQKAARPATAETVNEPRNVDSSGGLIDGSEFNRALVPVQGGLAALDADTVNFIGAAANRIRGHNTKVVQSIIAIGLDLIGVKHRLDHGQFADWLANEFDWTDRTAQNYMRADGVPLEVIAHALLRNADGSPSGVLGAALDRLLERGER